MNRENSKSGISGVDAGLLVLRIGTGVSILVLFGLAKLQAGSAYIHTGQWQFVDFNRKLGLPAPVLVAFLQTLNESVGSLLVACGLMTRYAAASAAIGFAVATLCSLKAGEPTWLLAAYYCMMFTTVLLAGPGQISIDHLLQAKSSAKLTDRVAAE